MHYPCNIFFQISPDFETGVLFFQISSSLQILRLVCYPSKSPPLSRFSDSAPTDPLLPDCLVPLSLHCTVYNCNTHTAGTDTLAHFHCTAMFCTLSNVCKARQGELQGTTVHSRTLLHCSILSGDFRSTLIHTFSFLG